VAGEAPADQTLTLVPAWIEAHCVVPDGFRRGEPLELYAWQLRWFKNFYLVKGTADWDPRNPLRGTAFVFQRGLLVGPQKLGKNPMIAAHVAAEFVGPVLFAGWAGPDEGYACADHGCRCGWEYPYEIGEPRGMAWPTPKIQVTAFSEDSTENTYDALRPMISQGPLADLLPKAGEEFIRHPSGAEDARIDTVTSSNQSRLGGRTTFVPQDEVGLWTPQAKLVKLADTQYRNLAGMGGRAALTSNAWDPAEHSVAQREYESSAVDVYRQFVLPPANLSFANKAERRKIFRLVYPPEVLREAGGHVDLDGIEAEAAKLAEHDEAQAARFFGNMLVAGAGVAVEPDAWDALARPDVEVPAKANIGLGFDGSVSNDATFLRGCTEDGHSFILGAWVRPTDPQDLARWRAEHPKEPEWRVIRSEVHNAVREAFGQYQVGRMFCDPPRWYTEIEDWAAEFGEDVVLALDTNQASRMAPAVARWRTAIAEGTHTHDGHAPTSAHVKAAHLRKVKLAADEEDGRTMYVIVKGDDRRKIDGAVADILAFEAAMSMPTPEPPPRPFVLGGTR
jgi:hypothetical protein